jgi:hypothetical protein
VDGRSFGIGFFDTRAKLMKEFNEVRFLSYIATRLDSGHTIARTSV